MVNKVLYKLQTDDILAVAKDMGIPKEKITDDVIRSVVKGWESGLDWDEVTKIALDDALEITKKCNCHYQCGCDKGKCNCYSLTPT